jgi:hypothetical protein
MRSNDASHTPGAGMPLMVRHAVEGAGALRCTDASGAIKYRPASIQHVADAGVMIGAPVVLPKYELAAAVRRHAVMMQSCCRDTSAMLPRCRVC